MSVLRPGFHGRLCLPVAALAFFLFLAVAALVSLPGCADDDHPFRPPFLQADLSGVALHDDGFPAEGASVYLARDPEYWSGAAAMVIDSTLADGGGRFAFDDLGSGRYLVYAGIWNRAGQDFFEVSPFSPVVDLQDPPAKASAHLLNLQLRNIRPEGVVAGRTVYWDGTAEAPADSAAIRLYRYRGAQLVMEQEARTTKAGEYALPGVVTGNYTVTAQKILTGEAPFPFYVSAESPAFFCDGLGLARVAPLYLTEVAVEKPAVYLYPAVAGPHDVRLGLSDLIRLTASIPEYGQGWHVFAEPSGRLDGRWDYLFYEVAMRGTPVLAEGWCLAHADLAAGLARIVRQLGLSDGETADFLDYWLTRLPRRPFHLVRPLLGGDRSADLDALVTLEVTPRPDAVLRFWLFFEGADDPADLTAPRITPFVRRGSVAVEWGGAVVPPGPHPRPWPR